MAIGQLDCAYIKVFHYLSFCVPHYRVLIFTQMARMLDVLEIFLNYHGHAYLRLDGATPVQKRQVRTYCVVLLVSLYIRLDLL